MYELDEASLAFRDIRDQLQTNLDETCSEGEVT